MTGGNYHQDLFRCLFILHRRRDMTYVADYSMIYTYTVTKKMDKKKLKRPIRV